MTLPLLIGLETVRIVRTGLYQCECLWLRQHCSPGTVALANAMERAIAANEGFPPGHYYLRPQLQLIESKESQETITSLEEGGKGHAAMALTFIEYQMAYQRGDVTIIYTAVPIGVGKLIVFDSISFPGKMLFG
jgi:hypothetical protein